MEDNKKATPEDLVDSVKGLSLTPVLTAILKPSADLLGSELRDALKAGIDKLKASRQSSNLRAHIEEVRRDLGGSTEKFTEIQSAEQLELFESWTEGAAKVDPEEEELARIWQMLLADIIKNKRLSRILLERAKQLSPEDARVLLRVRRRFIGVFFGPSSPQLERLATLGFISERRSFVPLMSILCSLAVFTSLLSKTRYWPGYSLIEKVLNAIFDAPSVRSVLFDSSEQLTFALVLSLAIGGTVYIILKESVRFLRLTNLGRKLALYARPKAVQRYGVREAA